MQTASVHLAPDGNQPVPNMVQPAPLVKPAGGQGGEAPLLEPDFEAIQEQVQCQHVEDQAQRDRDRSPGYDPMKDYYGLSRKPIIDKVIENNLNSPSLCLAKPTVLKRTALWKGPYRLDRIGTSGASLNLK